MFAFSLAVAAVAAAAAAASASGNVQLDVARPWLDSKLPIHARVSLLMKEMTLEEKANQLQHTTIGMDPSSAGVQQWLKAGGFGAQTIEATDVANGTHCDAACRISNLRRLQLAFLNETRLGIPLSFAVETSHCGAAGGTIFPMGVTQGSSWNVSMVHQIGKAIAKEARGWGGDRGKQSFVFVFHFYFFLLQIGPGPPGRGLHAKVHGALDYYSVTGC